MLFSEPKIPQMTVPTFAAILFLEFQCSSASRKFLKGSPVARSSRPGACFSALQRAENSSNSTSATTSSAPSTVSVLFSEPKIPQSRSRLPSAPRRAVSVLFSEPKIPQTSCRRSDRRHNPAFQCSSASRKFLKHRSGRRRRLDRTRFSALQRAENSSNFTKVRYI